MSETATGRLAGRSIVLGVTGSIAAYKAVELLRRLTAEGARVQVLMTRSAAAFVGPLTFETLSGRPVLLDPLELLPDARIGHVVAARSADAIVVAPATAHWLAAMATGLAGDVITATCLASHAPVVVAPAMDAGMYAHPATRANVERLHAFGYTIVEPATGVLASGLIGQGRLAEPAQVVDAVVASLATTGSGEPGPAGAAAPSADMPRAGAAGDFAGRRVVVTAGGTAEPIDPVRFIGNRSSGRMGVAIAEAALARGARVTLIVGLTSVPLPAEATIVHGSTTAAMRSAVLDALPGADVLAMAAAVADFRPRRQAAAKLTRDQAPTLELEPTEDILAEASQAAARLVPRPVLVGFAAETGSLDRAAEKARRKGVDLLVANDVLEPGAGFGVDTNRVTLVVPGSAPEPWPLMSKREVADRLLDRVAAILAAREHPAGREAPSAGQSVDRTGTAAARSPGEVPE